MKKLIISLLAFMALLLGLAGCSGDLHDKPLIQLSDAPYWGINGPMGMKDITISGGVGTVEFKATSGGWDASSGDMKFTIYAQATEEALHDSDNWWSGTLYRIGGFDVSLDTETVMVQAGDNITLKGIADGETYVATISNGAIKVSKKN